MSRKNDREAKRKAFTWERISNDNYTTWTLYRNNGQQRFKLSVRVSHDEMKYGRLNVAAMSLRNARRVMTNHFSQACETSARPKSA